MELIFASVLIGVVLAVISGPLRRRPENEPSPESEAGALEVARDAKYGEILDTQLDYQTGKLSEPDYREIDQALRTEAIELMRRAGQEGR